MKVMEETAKILFEDWAIAPLIVVIIGVVIIILSRKRIKYNSENSRTHPD